MHTKKALFFRRKKNYEQIIPGLAGTTGESAAYFTTVVKLTTVVRFTTVVNMPRKFSTDVQTCTG